MTIPTAAAQMVPFEDLATGARAGPDIVQYLKARSLDRVPTLALIADKNDDVDRHVIQPYIDGHKDSQGVVHQAPAGEEPVARAILHHMWLEARRQWGIHSIITAPAMQPPQSTATASGAVTSNTTDATDEKVPKTFPQWAAQVEKYNRITVNGERRRFCEAKLTGAEQILARVWHEHTKTKMYTPITLGEILAKRTFTATGEVNPLALPKTGHTTATTQALRLGQRAGGNRRPAMGPTVHVGHHGRRGGSPLGMDHRRDRRRTGHHRLHGLVHHQSPEPTPSTRPDPGVLDGSGVADSHGDADRQDVQGGGYRRA